VLSIEPIYLLVENDSRTRREGDGDHYHRRRERGNRLELPWLSGSVAELGEQMGIAVPRNRAVSDILALYVTGHKSD